MEIQPVSCPTVPQDFHLQLRKRFYHKLVEVASQTEHFNESFCLFKGIGTVPKNYEDNDHLVEQEGTFWYLFGVQTPHCYALIDNKSGRSILFVPRLGEDYKLWMTIKDNANYQRQSLTDEVRFVDELQQCIRQSKAVKAYVYSGVDSDSKLKVDEPQGCYLGNLQVDRELLWPLLSNLRVIKTVPEIDILRYVCKLTTEAHLIAMRSARAGLTQMQMHSVFHFQHSIRSGSTRLAFDSICSSGQDCATLHYIQNDKIIQPGQLVLHDMGGKWYGYVADQAITFPIDGKFTPKQREIYQAVYEAQKAVLQALKPGVSWEQMHLLAERVILSHLIKIGIVREFSLGELEEKRIGAIFFPHGLGHFFGLRVHDVGGYTKGPLRSDKAGLRSLRTRRVMEEGMCITVEPGLYFIDFILKKSLQDPETAKYLNEDKIREYVEVGGIRLQDNVLITSDGIQMLSLLPRTVQEVQNILAAKGQTLVTK